MNPSTKAEAPEASQSTPSLKNPSSAVKSTVSKPSRHSTELTSASIKSLRALGHHLRPVVQLGKSGITENVHKAILAGLAAHELIKVKLQPEFDGDRKETAATLAIAANAILVQVLGRTFLLYKKHPKKPKALPTDDTPKKSGNMSLRRRREAKVKKARKKRAAHAETRASEIDERGARFPRRRY